MATLRRSLERYEGCTANAIASGSKAQMMYFVEDAKADIATMGAALVEAKEAISYAMRGTADAEQSDKYAATIAKIDAALSASPATVADPTLHASTSPGPVNCNTVLRAQGKPMPRTCERCGLGPCPFFDESGNSLHKAGAQ